MKRRRSDFSIFFIGLALALTIAAAELRKNVQTVASDHANKGFPDISFSANDELYGKVG